MEGQKKEEQDAIVVSRDNLSTRALMTILIVVAVGIGFGKIVGVDSVPDRTMQNYKLAQIPKTMEERSKALRDKGVVGERYEAEMERIYNALLADASKARPTLCANDRSRWATIRALVEKDARVYRFVPDLSSAEINARIEELKERAGEDDGKVAFKYYPEEILVNCAAAAPERFEKKNMKAKRYVKKLVPYAIDKAWETPGWDSIDVVKHGLPDEVWRPENPSSGYLYSSKPPLLPTVMAAPYWFLHNVFGLSLVKNPFLTTRILLVFYNLIPLAIAFICLARVVDSLGASAWTKIFALASAIFGFFCLSYVATLNNHVPGFAAISIALWAAHEILLNGRKSAWYYVCAGFFGAFAVACDLPATAFALFLCVTLLVKRPKKTILCAIPAGLVVAAAFLATNYIAHGIWTPAYAHKRDHMDLQRSLAGEGSDASESYDVELSFDPNDWYYYAYYPAGRPREMRYAVLSHWANRTGIDKGEPSIARYAFHSTIGLRGVFSLSPIWILSIIGAILWLVERRGVSGNSSTVGSVASPTIEDKARVTKLLASMTLTLTVVFFWFFMTRDQGDRNYGGVCCSPRWFFPLAPFFALCLMPALERCAKNRALRWIAYAALAWSVASAFYPTWTPWTSPWLYQIAVDGGLFTPY